MVVRDESARWRLVKYHNFRENELHRMSLKDCNYNNYDYALS